MGYDYRGFRDNVSGDLSRAALRAGSLGGGQQRKLRLKESDLGRVPAGATVEMETVAFHRLRRGDVILVRNDGDVRLRRFLRLGMTGSRTLLIVTHDRAEEGTERMNSGALVGRVVSAHYQGHSYDPGRENAVQAMLNRLTDYGTTNPLRKIAQGAATFLKVMRLA